jgi:hypothetical protein
MVTWNDFGEGTAIEPTREYGFRDLHLIQDLRCGKPAAEPTRTNDLSSAFRFYNLRRSSATNAALASALDQVFTNFVSGREESAVNQLSKLEAQFR